MHLILLLAIVASFVTACKDDETPSPDVTGYWVGNYTSGVNVYTYAALFRSNGTVRVFNNSDTASAGKAEGTYTVTDSVRATYTYIVGSDVYSFAAKLNDAATVMIGTWGEGTSTTVGGGNITLAK